jgi:hypothetical protein
MAFLDDLKKEAELRKQQAARESHNKTIQVTRNFLLVQSGFKQIKRFLDDLASQLNVVNMEVIRPYYIDGFGLVEDFRQEDYAVKVEKMAIDQKEFVNSITLRFKCSTGKVLSFEKSSFAAIDMEKTYLWENGLKHKCTEYKNDKGIVDRAQFVVESQIPINLKITADFEHARLFWLLKNFNGLTSNDFVYDADEIDEALLNEFAKYLVERPNDFKNMGRHQARQPPAKAVAGRRPDETDYPRLDPRLEEELEKKQTRKGLFSSIKSLLSS